ncbi:hypothetical protein FRC12_017580, partial [Ceratobasidium sp. 428]
GGAFYQGDIKQYPGTALVERSVKIGKPIIYVAINYWIGLFGFPPGQTAVDAGGSNLGLKDQRLALEWIQTNIAYFGGDPKKVIVCAIAYRINLYLNEQLGHYIWRVCRGLSVGYQSLYKDGRIGGAFRGMILQSGSPSSEETLKRLVEGTNCTSAPNPYECVRSTPSDILARLNDEVMKAQLSLACLLRLTPLAELVGPTVLSPRTSSNDFRSDNGAG